MRGFPELAKHMPWNSVQRRNVGHLLAWIEGFEMLIALDDDNFRVDDDYIGLHMAALEAPETEAVKADSGWFNCCSLLEEAQGRQFFPRGYPISRRRGAPGNLSYGFDKRRVVVNAGLWLGDPDIDAITRLAIPIDATKLRRPRTLALAAGTWCPFNSQTTALHRDVLPSWFMSPYLGRFDDIWASYILLACADKLGHAVAFGKPLVRQDRNVHNLWHDLDLERLGLQNTEGFCEALRNATMKGDDYASCALGAIDALEKWTARGNFTPEHRASLEALVTGYRLWIEALKKAVRQPAVKLSA